MAVFDPRAHFEAAEQRALARLGIQARTRFIAIADPPLRIRVLEIGEGPPLLLVHGGGGNADNWLPLLAELKGFRVLAVDRPGCGLSDPFLYDGVDLRRHAVSFLASVLDALELPAAPIIANSMGGTWSFWLALDHPQRISALAQLGCPALILDTGAPLSLRLMSLPLFGRVMMGVGRPSPKRLRMVMRMLGEEDAYERFSVEQKECAFRAQLIPGVDETFRTLVATSLSLRGGRFDLEEGELRRVSQPLMFLWGERDPFGGIDVAKRATSLIPNARLEVLAAGHLPWFDEPARCAASICAFLRQPALV